MIDIIDKEPIWKRILFKIGLLRKISPPLTIKELVELANKTEKCNRMVVIDNSHNREILERIWIEYTHEKRM